MFVISLFKIFKGTRSDFETEVPTGHDGYAYFITDTGEFAIDYQSGDKIIRQYLNAAKALKLYKEEDGDIVEIDYDHIVQTDDIIDVEHGGTGLTNANINALLAGNGINSFKSISTASGALYATTANGEAQFGTLPIAQGGTAGTTAQSARSNLSVYSKSEVDDRATTKAYTFTLAADGWTVDGDEAYQSYSNTALKCGAEGNVPPMITYASNPTDYAKIEHAEATAGTGIIFYIKSDKAATIEDIDIIIVDNR